ncbi:MAG: 2-hydroxychromene-2-carboxylate isomerase [Cognaticolwellia sp.]|jgi:2-hydroxychromene-2-carboxylate isomerase
MRIPPRLVAIYLGPELQRLNRWLQALGRQKRIFRFFHSVGDPGSTLALHALAPLMSLGNLELILAAQPKPEFTPDPERQRIWALNDAKLLSQVYGLPCPSALPTPGDVAQAQAIACKGRPAAEQLQLLLDLGTQLFSGAPQLDALSRDHGRVDLASCARTLEQGARRREALGHYASGALCFEGEWYPGLERFNFLFERLREEEERPGQDQEAIPALLPTAPSIDLAGAEQIQAYLSFRSPYSYLAVQRLILLSKRSGLPLAIHPVLPMVMRGLEVPRTKRLYLAWDAGRVARSLDIPFGKIADPLGTGVERCLAICPWAEEQGKLADFFVAATSAIWSQGVDVSGDKGLILVCEQAGLDPQAALAQTNDTRWRSLVEDNRLALLELGLWGVPSVKIGETVIWGQDRLGWVEQAMGL